MRRPVTIALVIAGIVVFVFLLVVGSGAGMRPGMRP